ncbi:MAG: hypothetical protein JMDDDDMK_01506 [Acidobacteria bacterium]|nr:hypothetical protein [Acidobacteriota bacterium]
MSNRLATFSLIALLGVIAAAQSKDFWQTKDYKQWTEKECKKLLDDSPWARDYTLKQVFIETLQSSSMPGGQPATGERERAPSSRMGYQIQLRSALPIRQAMVRQQMIAEKYDLMAPDKKQEFDERAGKFLSADFNETIMVHVRYSASVQVYDRELAQYWHNQTTETIKNTTSLIASNGQKIQPLRYTASTGAGREFQLVFPRQINGQPLIGPKDKSIKLEFKHPRVGNEGEARVLIEFKADKMTINNVVVY